jgi:SPP1 gp7 family putative phage head morphogenesis protein
VIDRAQLTARRAARARAAAAKAPRARVVPRTKYPSADERALRGALEQAGAGLAAAIRRAAPALLEYVRRERLELGRRDAAPPRAEDIGRTILDFSVEQLENLDAAARRVGAGVSEHQRRELRRQLLAGLGGDVEVPDAGARRLVDHFTAENVGHVRGVAAEVSGRIARAVAAAVTSGQPVEDLADNLEAIAELTPKRARAVARDQVGKLFGAVARARQEELGIEEYVWDTVKDAKVRPTHKHRQDVVFSWSKPPPGGHPGEDYNCRCTARPKLDQILARRREVEQPAPEFSITQIGVDRAREVPHRTIEVVSAPDPTVRIGMERIIGEAEDLLPTPTVTEPLRAGPYGPQLDDEGAAELAEIINSTGYEALTFDKSRGTVTVAATGRVFSERTYLAANQIQIDRVYEAERAEEKRRAKLGVFGRASEDLRGALGRLFRRKR